jgi:hypothetical protein
MGQAAVGTGMVGQFEIGELVSFSQVISHR